MCLRWSAQQISHVSLAPLECQLPRTQIRFSNKEVAMSLLLKSSKGLKSTPAARLWKPSSGTSLEYARAAAPTCSHTLSDTVFGLLGNTSAHDTRVAIDKLRQKPEGPLGFCHPFGPFLAWHSVSAPKKVREMQKWIVSMWGSGKEDPVEATKGRPLLSNWIQFCRAFQAAFFKWWTNPHKWW